MEITQYNKEVLAGTLLGDSSLQFYEKYHWKNPIFKCDHGEPQKEYAYFLCKQLENLGAVVRHYSRFDKRTQKTYETYSVRTPTNPGFHWMYKELYSTGHKEVTRDFLQNFTAVSLAYLYMDDGYAGSGYYGRHTATICSDSFSKESQELLIEFFEEKFDLHFTIIKHGKFNRLRLSQYDIDKFIALVEPYMLDSLKYKINTLCAVS